MKRLIAAIERLIADTDGFVNSWGVADPGMAARLEAFIGYVLPGDYRALLDRFGNLHIGYWPISGLGPLSDLPAAQALTEERREEWPALPRDRLVLGERNTDMIVLAPDGSVEFRTESTRDLAVFRQFSSFSAFVEYCITQTVEDAVWLDLVAKGILAIVRSRRRLTRRCSGLGSALAALAPHLAAELQR